MFILWCPVKPPSETTLMPNPSVFYTQVHGNEPFLSKSAVISLLEAFQREHFRRRPSGDEHLKLLNFRNEDLSEDGDFNYEEARTFSVV